MEREGTPGLQGSLQVGSGDVYGKDRSKDKGPLRCPGFVLETTVRGGGGRGSMAMVWHISCCQKTTRKGSRR